MPAAGLSAKSREKVNFNLVGDETLRDHYKHHQYQDVILPSASSAASTAC